jgi:hypothetical protein
MMGVGEAVEQGEAGATEGTGRRDLSEEDLSVRDGSEVAAGGIEDDDVEIARIVRREEGKVVVTTQRLHVVEVCGMVEVVEYVDIVVGYGEASLDGPGRDGDRRVWAGGRVRHSLLGTGTGPYMAARGGVTVSG